MSACFLVCKTLGQGLCQPERSYPLLHVSITRPIFLKDVDPPKGNFWIVNLFKVDVNWCNPNSTKKESLIELSCDATLMFKHNKVPSSQFWMSLKNEYPQFSEKAMK